MCVGYNSQTFAFFFVMKAIYEFDPLHNNEVVKSRREKMMQIYSLNFVVANYTCFQIWIAFDIYLHFENQTFFHLNVLG